MSSDLNLTPEMRRAVERARHNGGKLKRRVGGHWVGANEEGAVPDSFSTRTAEALVSRGVAIYSAKQSGRNGEFPVELTLTEVAAKVGARPVIGVRDPRVPMFGKNARQAIAEFRGGTDETPARSRERETKRIGDILPGLGL